MSLTPPPAVNYPGQLIFRPNPMLSAYGSPKESAGSISVEIDWASMGGSSQCVSINPNSNTINPSQISQIAALYVDNSSSQADARFIFTDSGLTITVPAFSGGLFPVVTNGTAFFVEAGHAIPSDVTRFLILNVNPPPVQIAQPSVMQEAAVFNAIAPAAGTTQLVALGIDGSVRSVNVYYQLGATAAGNESKWVIEDGNNVVIAGGQFSDNLSASNTSVNALGLDLNNVDLPFVNGLKFVITAIGGAGWSANAGIAINIVYETP